eukprot:scaffold26933_cov36-Phaeocystis_antarctica.AAC.1
MVLAGEPAAAERDGPRLRSIVRSPAPLLDQSVEVQRPRGPCPNPNPNPSPNPDPSPNPNPNPNPNPKPNPNPNPNQAYPSGMTVFSPLERPVQERRQRMAVGTYKVR